MNNKRILWIDYAKAVAIFLVVVGHSFSPTGGGNLEIKNFIYSFHMPVFFFLSGYLWKLKEPGFMPYLKSSVKSLLVPYALLNILAAVIMIPLLAISHNYDDITNRALETLMGGAHCFAGPAWFLWSLFWIRLLMYLGEKTKTSLLILIISIAAAYLIGGFVWWDLSSAFAAFPFFYLGYVTKEKSWIKGIRKSQWVLIMCISLLILLWINHINGSVAIYSLTFGKYPWLYYVETFIGITFFISLMNLIAKRENRIINTLSRESIMIMALHGAISIYVAAVLSRILPLSDTTFVYALLLSTIVVIILYYPCRIIQNKWPVISGGR